MSSSSETSGLRDVPDLRVALEHQRSHSGQAQLNGEHQAGWAGAHDDHIAHFDTPRSPSVVTSNRALCRADPA
jgi:hypothetical protein